MHIHSCYLLFPLFPPNHTLAAAVGQTSWIASDLKKSTPPVLHKGALLLGKGNGY